MNQSRWLRLLFIISLLVSVCAGTADAWWHKTKSMDATAGGKDTLLKPVRGKTNADAFSKLGRGITNVIEGPFELYAQTVLMPSGTDAVYTVIGGITRGISMVVVRELVGIYDIVTFPIPYPQDYKPLIQPATTFTDLDRRAQKFTH